MLFGLWPTCARKDCGAPAFVKFEFTEGEEVLEAWICFGCMGKVPELFCATAGMREEDRKLSGSLGEIVPVEDENDLPEKE